jgi:vitamin B12/bleomycin/antimicrobial peptide transport system ATP-binding/permease protein
MDTNTFKPSIDWGNELFNSARWILEAFAVTAPCLLVVLVVVARLTEWGRQFWRISGDYFKGRQGVPVYALIAVLLVSTIASVRINVLLAYYANDVFTALQVAFEGAAVGRSEVKDFGINGFWLSMIIFAILATVHVLGYLLDMYLMQRVNHALANLVELPLRRQLARRPHVLPSSVPACADRPPRSTHSKDIDVFTTGVGDVNHPS